MKRVSSLGIILMIGVMVGGCGSTPNEKRFPSLMQGKVTRVDKKNDMIFVDTGSVRSGADLSVNGAMAASRDSLPKKGDYVLLGYDSSSRRVDTLITIKK